MLLPGQKLEPQKEGHARILPVIREALGSLHAGFLNHITRINATLETPVHAQSHHAAEAISVPSQQGPPFLRVSLRSRRKQLVCFAGIVGHHGCHRYLTARRSFPETPKMKIL